MYHRIEVYNFCKSQLLFTDFSQSWNTTVIKCQDELIISSSCLLMNLTFTQHFNIQDDLTIKATFYFINLSFFNSLIFHNMKMPDLIEQRWLEFPHEEHSPLSGHPHHHHHLLLNHHSHLFILCLSNLREVAQYHPGQVPRVNSLVQHYQDIIAIFKTIHSLWVFNLVTRVKPTYCQVFSLDLSWTKL